MVTTKAVVASEADLEYLRTIGTGVVHDALERLGLKGSARSLLPYVPLGKRHIAGPAVTVRYLPARGTGKPLTSMYELMKKAGKGTVIVVDGQGTLGHFTGGNQSHMAKRNGVEAVVIDGGFRDGDEIRGYGTVVFSTRGLTPHGAGGSTMLISDVDIPISCDGVHVRPGDIVVGDNDGVVFIPSEAYGQVMANVRDIDKIEQQTERAIATDQPMEAIKELLSQKKNRKL